MRLLRRSRHDEGRDAEEARRAWPDGYEAALSLSFDDARRSQIDVGLDVIDQLGVTVTFYVLPSGVDQDRRGWRNAARAGHEIGNHTARHPCSANFDWTRHHAIEDLTLEDMATEIRDADIWIREALEVETRTFAYPCGHTVLGRGTTAQSFVPLVAARFLAGRTFNDVATNSPRHCDLAQVNAMCSDGLVLDQLLPALEATHDAGAWLVLGGHEIDQRVHAETTSPATLAGIVEWCRAHQVWIDTIGNVADRVELYQQAEKAESS